MTPCTFWVDGSPASKGSWRPVKTRAGKVRLIPQITAERPWASAVAWCAKASGIKPTLGAKAVIVSFYFARPEKPKHGYPSKGDTDKLVRSVLDALQGVAYANDSSVVRIVAEKCWADARGPGANITIEEVA